MYNSLEERALIKSLAHNDDVPGVVVGVGSEVPEQTHPERFRREYGVRGPFAIYIGRIDENKGCHELFQHFIRYAASRSPRLSLVLIGNPIMPVPDHPRIRHLGVLPDADKFDALAAADALIMPSYYESLSMVALEAWALGPTGAGQRTLRRAERSMRPEQRRPLLRELRRVCGDAPPARVEPAHQRLARSEWAQLLWNSLQLADDRAQVSRRRGAA